MNPLEAPDLNDAMARLEAAEAAEQPTPEIEQVQSDGEPPATPPEQPTGDVAKPDPISSDTPAAADTNKPAEPAKKSPPTPDKTSAFAKDAARRDTSWKALNEQKQKFEQERAQLTALRDSFAREQEQFKVQQAKSTQKYTPEQYEQAAQQRETSIGGLIEQAEAWEARAEKLESSGDFKGAALAKGKAESIRDDASLSKAQARQFRDTAAHLRANPDPTLEQVRQKNEHAMREFTLKAVEKWPEFGQQGGEFQKKVTQELQEARRNGIEVNENPVLLYHAARLVAAETTSARVPEMEKELGQLRAKVKELEALTAPGGGRGSVQTQPTGNQPQSDEQEYDTLRAQAMTF